MKERIMKLIKQYGGHASYSGKTRTIFVHGAWSVYRQVRQTAGIGYRPELEGITIKRAEA